MADEKQVIDITDAVEEAKGEKAVKSLDDIPKRKTLDEVDPAVLMDALEEVNVMVDAHVALLCAIKTLVWKFKKSGLSAAEATGLAFELHKRASAKANELVDHDPPEDAEKAVDKEEQKDDAD